MIKPNHYLFKSNRWSPKMLKSLPESLYLWMAADTIARHEVLDKHSSNDLYLSNMLWEASSKNETSDNLIKHWEWDIPNIKGCTTNRKRTLVTCVTLNSRSAHKKIWYEPDHFSFDLCQKEEKNWQMAHLRSLAQIWSICGERTPSLILEGFCPLQVPRFCEGLSFEKTIKEMNKDEIPKWLLHSQ